MSCKEWVWQLAYKTNIPSRSIINYVNDHFNQSSFSGVGQLPGTGWKGHDAPLRWAQQQTLKTLKEDFCFQRLHSTLFSHFVLNVSFLNLLTYFLLLLNCSLLFMFREWIKQYSCKTQVILFRNPSQKATKYSYGIKDSAKNFYCGLASRKDVNGRFNDVDM